MSDGRTWSLATVEQDPIELGVLKRWRKEAPPGGSGWSARRRDPLPKLDKLSKPVTLDSS